jgi:hypothetical protein
MEKEFKAAYYRPENKHTGEIGPQLEVKIITAPNKTTALAVAKGIAKQLDWRFLEFNDNPCGY